MGCMAARPIVDGLARDLGDRARVVRLDIGSKAGKAIAAGHGVRTVPTILVLDGTGARAAAFEGFPRRQAILAVVESLTGAKESK